MAPKTEALIGRVVERHVLCIVQQVVLAATAIEHKAALASLFSSLSRLLHSFIRSFALALVLFHSRTVRLAVPWICWTFQPTLLAVLVKASCEWSSVFRARWFCSIIERDVASGRSGRAPQPHSDRVVG